ncbi:hypothetical protein N7G274_001497 [Stereocaulon virgatum]|uniref:Uncharacterized protein n=1 Tax=Stereocaulon virgatum TaxID=373712 RepID=A0ABR4ALG6_9LECA
MSSNNSQVEVNHQTQLNLYQQDYRMVREQPKTGRLPPSYYLQQRQELAVQARTRPRTADNTKKSLTSILKKWNRFCRGLSHNSSTFLTEA